MIFLFHYFTVFCLFIAFLRFPRLCLRTSLDYVCFFFLAFLLKIFFFSILMILRVSDIFSLIDSLSNCLCFNFCCLNFFVFEICCFDH